MTTVYDPEATAAVPQTAREYWALYAPDRVIRDGEECEHRCVAWADALDDLADKAAARDWGGPGFYRWAGSGHAGTIPEALAAAGDAWGRLRAARPRAVAEYRLKGEQLHVQTAHSGGAGWSVSADEQIVEPIPSRGAYPGPLSLVRRRATDDH